MGLMTRKLCGGRNKEGYAVRYTIIINTQLRVNQKSKKDETVKREKRNHVNETRVKPYVYVS